MKNDYFGLFNFDCKLMHSSLSMCRFSFNDTIDEFLEKISKKHPWEECIEIKKGNIEEIAADSEEELKKVCSEYFGKVDILEYYDKSGNILKEFNSNCHSIKISRPPVIHDIMARYLDYQSESPYFSHEDSFNDIHCSNIIKELKAWYEGEKISVIRNYSYNDITLCYKSRCEDNVDRHIPKQIKAEIIRDLFSYMTLEVESVLSKDLITSTLESLNRLKSCYKLNNTGRISSEIENLITESSANVDFLKSIGFDPNYISNIDKSVIVVSHINGILANKNLFTGKITFISKYYNNDKDPDKSNVYFEKSEVTVNREYFKVATVEDIYTYRENYYLLDGTQPFLNMTIEEIINSIYLNENI